MDARERKGLEIAARMRVVREGATWSVPSQTGSGKYRVDPAAPSCSCEDFATTASPCKHLFAVRFVIERECGNEPTTPASEPVEDAPTAKRPTYRQNWPAYVRAQTTEKDRFRGLLADLCRGLEEPSRAKTGRKPVPLADRVFVCCDKVWSGLSGRRFNCDLDAAHRAGHLSRAVHPHKISAFMDDAELTPVLYRLITETSKPLAAVEVDFAADSSGFTTSRFVRWFDVKYGAERKRAEWVKVHVMTGVKTNVVTAAEIRGRDASDTKLLPELVDATAENFTLNEVSADRAYGSLSNYAAIERHGATPFIAFKSIHSGKGGGLWAKMFGYFQYRRDDFLAHYHKRSNVESTFSMVKRKFGDAVRSKTDAAMVNEVLCKLVCHNIGVLIHEQEELGITPEFWGSEPDDELPSIIRFPDRVTRNTLG